MTKFAIALFSDAQDQKDENLGRVLNALILAQDLKSRGSTVKVFFQGAGTRWVNVLEESSHPGHTLYKNLKDDIAGASEVCSAVFKANVTTVPLINEYQVEGLGGATSLAKYIEQNYTLINF